MTPARGSRSAVARGVARTLTATVALGLVVSPGQAAERPTGTLRDLRGREVAIDTEAPVEVAPEEVIRQYERVIQTGSADPRIQAEALRRLGDLKLEADELARGENGLPADPAQLQEAIRSYESLLATYPDAPRNDLVRYQLARAYEAANLPEQALVVLTRLVADAPSSTRWTEAQFRRGELLFSAGRYTEAETAYAAVVVQGTATGFYEQGLYKQGWSLFKLARQEQSITAFLALLDRTLVGGGRLREDADLAPAERELTADALGALSTMFADAEGAAAIDGTLARYGRPPYAYRLYESLGNLYLEQERYQDAALAYAAFVKGSPGDLTAPILQVRAIEAYRRGGFESLVIDGKRAFVEQYALDGPFWRDRAPAAAPEVLAELRTHLRDLAQYHHAQAQKTKAAEDYAQAARWYRAMLQSLPDDADVPGTRYLLAEVLFEAGRFDEAAVEYARTAYDYPAHARSADAGYASVVAYQRQEARLEGTARTAWQAQAIENELKFANQFPEHAEAGAVLTRVAENLFALDQFDRTIEVARQVLERQPPVDAQKQRAVATILAHSLFDRGRYAEAEQAYARVQALLPAQDPDRVQIVDRLAASIYRQAEAKQAAGAADAAVDDFLRVARLAPTSGVRANAEFDAAALLLKEKQYARAAEVLTAFRTAHPKHELEPEVTRSLAVAYLESGDAPRAAPEFERIAARDAEPAEVRRAAQWQAAELYEKARDTGSASRAYNTYVERYPVPLDAAMDARQKLVDMAAAAGDERGRQRGLEAIIQADAQAGPARTERSRYLAARATLSTVDAAVAAFNAQRLVVPLDRSLRTKRAAMERALTVYGKALDYQVAEVTTAATFGMAELYRQLGVDLLASERPRNLDAEAREQYDVLLEEQAFPFEEKAIELHQANAARTPSGVYDQWVQRSFDQLAKLLPARYAKTELGEDHVATLR